MGIGRRPLILLGTPILIAALGFGGYFSYQSLQSQHQDNIKELELFGFGMVSHSPYTESIGELGATQLPATFAESDLTPTQKVIYGLMQDKDRLMDENRALKTQLQALEKQVSELQEYRELNERFAPESFDEEIRRVEKDLKAYLLRLPEAERFSNLQLEIMATSSAREYRRFVEQHRLMLENAERARIINGQLPAYAFCVGDATTIAANSANEERMLAQYLRTGDDDLLTAPLRNDLQIVLKPCQQALRKALEATL
ncbi:MAG: hypothetical protein HWE39_20260 [Oceanospirillaceae bacterium]|nr:hypothetical protein [Oceanospirillaceae bacterium]